MLRNASFALIALFWVVMNALLWHSEFRGGDDLSAPLPAAVVWEKVFTAPDASNLSLVHQRRKLGYLHWRPATGEDTSGKIASENEPEGIVRKLTEYKLDVDGSLVATNVGRAIRFNGDLTLTPELNWKRFRLQSFIKPAIWEIKGNARDRDLWIQAREGETEWIRRFTFDELANPATLFEDLESPVLAGLLAQYLPKTNGVATVSSPPGLKWEARQDWLTVGHERVRIYRLQTRLFGRLQVVIFVSRVGEILKVDLPGDFMLASDVLFPAL